MSKIAVTSATEDDNYAFSIPIINFCWNKLGVKLMVVTPAPIKDKILLALQYCDGTELLVETFTSPDYKEATYAQVARLYAAASCNDDDIAITTDADMCVFRDDFPPDDYMNILGADLVPPKQYPICFAWAKGSVWRDVMGVNGGFTIQENLDHELGPIECENFRGCQWSYDQSLLYRKVSVFQPTAFQSRARPGTQFARHRLDRDDAFMLDHLSPLILDFHMNRPGFTDDNFSKIMAVLFYFYPEENFDWLFEYRQQYLSYV